ncbi:MAG: hypothetical protein LBG43_01310 [Treponema sp.]|nr:hypothetical protein [Treponema sp.]
MAFELYINGRYAGSYGRLSPDIDVRTHSSAFLIPASVVAPGTAVTLELRCAHNGSTVTIPAYHVGMRKRRILI